MAKHATIDTAPPSVSASTAAVPGAADAGILRSPPAPPSLLGYGKYLDPVSYRTVLKYRTVHGIPPEISLLFYVTG